MRSRFCFYTLSGMLGIVLGIQGCKKNEKSNALGYSDRIVQAEASSVEYDTTYNPSDGSWYATMGPRKKEQGGIVCDYAGGEQAPGWQGAPYRNDPKHLIWYVAPSETLMSNLTGENLYCGQRENGQEPKCKDLRKFCGMKVKISVDGGRGTPNIIGKNAKGPGIQDPNAYKKFVELITQQAGEIKKVPQYVIAVINDYCPKEHSVNKPSGNCASNQGDLGPGPYLTLINTFNGEWVEPKKTKLKMQLLGHSNEPLGPVK